jgi:hypothetical protein
MSTDTVSVGFTAQLVQAAIKNWQIVLGVTLLIAAINEYIIYPFFTSPLANVPGPKLLAMTKWAMIWVDFTKKRTLYIHSLHEKYGPVVRVGPNELVFTGDEPMRTIYGAGTSFYKPAFYNLFVAYVHNEGLLSDCLGMPSVLCSRCLETLNMASDERLFPMFMQRHTL